jgi:IS605 OrfB family transposase
VPAELGLPSQGVQEVIDDFFDQASRDGSASTALARQLRRKAVARLDPVHQPGHRDRRIPRAAARHEIPAVEAPGTAGADQSGNFSQDARGRCHCNVVCEIEKPKATNRTKVVGIDLGLKTAAVACDGRTIEQSRFYRDQEARLAEAQRQGKKRLVKTIHAKIANRRKDALHKYSRAVVDGAGAVFVGDVSSSWQIDAGNGKAVLDVSWSALRNMIQYKCDHAGVMFLEVDENLTTQTCSCCGSVNGPKGREGLSTRRWECSECGAVHRPPRVRGDCLQ